MTVKKFESFSDFFNSDHYPIMAKLALVVVLTAAKGVGFR
jgi:heme exporter protein D